MGSFARLGAAALAAVLALALAAPLASARCSVASAPACPLMKAGGGSLCHRGGTSMAPAMSCCKNPAAPAPAPVSGSQPASPLLAVLPDGVRNERAPEGGSALLAVAAARIDPAADALHALGLFTLLAVFRN
jgi:hypothetical protein